MELPTDLLNAFVQLAGAVLAIIALTGFGKFVAEKTGKDITPNQVRAMSAVAATIVAVLVGVVGGTIPGVGPLPAASDPQAWLMWLLTSVTALTMFANAAWKFVYRPEPPTVVITPPPAPVPPMPTATVTQRPI